jgi:hypothetical protein
MHKAQQRQQGRLGLNLLMAAGLALLAILSGGVVVAGGASADMPAITATPTWTSTVTATGTPVPGEPELNILQYVVTNAGLYCQGPFGTPGHRYVTYCYPFMYGSHPTSGYVDGYSSASEAQANWQARRNSAFATYPIHFDTSYGPYPAYDAGNTAYPYAHYESFFWAQTWVMGAISSDDTSFRGAPTIAAAILRAAQALGYLPGGQTITPTLTPVPTFTPTYTPTNTPVPQRLLVGHVAFQGRPSQPSELQQLPVTLMLRSGNTVTTFPPVTTDASGFFTVSVAGLSPGQYDWWVKSPIFLAGAGMTQLASSNVHTLEPSDVVTPVEMGMLRVGDANDDNLVASQDFGILRLSFGLSLGDPNYDARADFSGDSLVSAADFVLLASSFGTAGASPP